MPRILQSPLRLALLGSLVGAFLAVLTLAPAFWLSQSVGYLSHQQVLLQHPTGTPLEGVGSTRLVLGQQQPLRLGTAHSTSLASETLLSLFCNTNT